MELNVRQKNGLTLFLLGLGSATRVLFVGCLSLSEIFAFFLAPLILLREYGEIKRVRATRVVWLLIFVILMIVISSVVNHAPFVFIIKEVAVYYSILSFIVVFIHFLKRDLQALRWYFLGAVISSLITIFILNPRAAVSSQGAVALSQMDVSDVINGELFWIEKVSMLLYFPIKAFYLNTPLMYVIIMPFIVLGVAAVTSMSGRSAALMAFGGCLLMVLGRKSRRSMYKIGRNFIWVVILGLLVILLFKQGYYYLAETGRLTDRAIEKHYHQTDGNKGVLGMIIVGRLEPFVGLTAALDRPLLGYGALPIDYEGYYYKTLLRYGNWEDAKRFEYQQQKKSFPLMLIQTHSHIISAWVACGIVGLLFWLYVMGLIYQFLRKYTASIPQWFGYFAIAIPTYVWHILFSPIATRRQDVALLIACLILARAVGNRILVLPNKMEMEARRYD